jgi:hypothetical protein
MRIFLLTVICVFSICNVLLESKQGIELPSHELPNIYFKENSVENWAV